MHAVSGALKLAFRPWKQSPIGQWCSVITLGLILTAGAFSAHLVYGFTALKNRLHHEQIATVYLASPSEEVQKNAVVDEIRLKLGSAAQSVNRVTAGEFLKTIETKHPDLAAEVATLGSDLQLITPEYVTVRGTISVADAEKLKSISGVEAVDLSIERMKPLVSQVNTFRAILIGTGALLLGCFFVVMNLLSQVNRNLHRESEALLAQLGGTRFQVKLPAVGDLALTGLLAGLIAMFLWSITDAFVVRHLSLWSPLFRDIPKIAPAHLLALPLVGFFLGWANGNLRMLKTRV